MTLTEAEIRYIQAKTREQVARAIFKELFDDCYEELIPDEVLELKKKWCGK